MKPVDSKEIIFQLKKLRYTFLLNHYQKHTLVLLNSKLPKTIKLTPVRIKAKLSEKINFHLGLQKLIDVYTYLYLSIYLSIYPSIYVFIHIHVR